MISTQFQPRDVVWTREKSSRFWDFKASQPKDQVTYFSDQVGSSLLRFVRSKGVPLRGRAVDFGCGTGHLLSKLVDQGIAGEGVDFSEESVHAVRERLGGNPLFRGAEVVTGIPTHLPADSFDTVLLIETIEHLLDDDLVPTARELHRIVKPGGNVIVSTPNAEPLIASQTMCPACGARFHMMQHVRSWTTQSLARFMEEQGFRTVFSEAVFLRPKWLHTRLVTRFAGAMGKSLPHLVWVGTKAG